MEGAQLGPYQVVSELGSGGMGSVYLATCTQGAAGLPAGTRVALKVIHAQLMGEPGFFKRFLREARVGQQVEHENVVRTFDCDATLVDGRQQHFLVMEYVEGQTLRDLGRELQRVPEELCRHIGREVARGLAAIHAAGIVHRDIKPENVLITPDHVVKVMDLGVARLQDEALRLSQTGMFVGSVHYAPPEAFREGGKHLDGRSDLYSLGLVLYELATGVNPCHADDLPQILQRVLHETPRRLGDLNPQVSPFFEELVHTLLAKQPEERFAEGETLAATLEAGEEAPWWRGKARALREASRKPLRRIRIPRETAVQGREDELALLRSLFEEAQAGDGRVVLIEGEAGIGKSRLVDELALRLEREGASFDFLFGSYPPGGAATAAGAFSTALREHLGEDDLGERLRGLLGKAELLAPSFAAVLQGSGTPAGAEPVTKDSLQTCFVTALRSLAAERPVVMLVDDLHFAKEEGLALFAALAMAVAGHRILLIGTTRPGLDEAWLAELRQRPEVTPLHVGRLGPKDLARLLAESFHSERLAAKLGHQVALKSDGNPFFAFEIIQGLREGQFITQQDDGTWISTRQIEEIEIPSSVLDLVNARVADLDEEERNLLDVAACWGFEFDPTLVGDVLGLGRIPVLRAFGQIERRHRLVRAAGRRMVFDHHQVQEALHASLLEPLREEYHAALAEALETRSGAAAREPEALDGALCVDLCEHFLAGARGPQALRYLAAAQAHLEEGYQDAQAAALGERALALPDLLAGAERARTLLHQAKLASDLGRRDEQERCAREAVALAAEIGDNALSSGAQHMLGTAMARTGRLAEAEEAFGRALAIARSTGHRKAEGSARSGLGHVCFRLDRFEESRAHHEDALGIARELGDRVSEAASTVNVGLAHAGSKRYEEAQDSFERGLALCRELDHRRFEANANGGLAQVLYAMGRHAQAQSHYERVLEIARAIGFRQAESAACRDLATHALLEGRLPEAREFAEEHVAIDREIGDRHFEAAGEYLLGDVAKEQGKPDTAAAHYAAALEIAETLGLHAQAADARLALADLRAPEVGPDETHRALQGVLDLARRHGLAEVETLACCRLAVLPEVDPGEALATFARHEERLEDQDRRLARLWLWLATGDAAHLVQARALLDDALAACEPDARGALASLRVNREITEAWQAQAAR